MLIDRIKDIINTKKISVRKFAENIGFNYTTLNNYCTGARITIDSVLLEKIISTYDDINAHWLLTGIGNMFVTDKSITERQDMEESVLYKIYKEKDAKVEAQAEQIGALKSTIRQQEEQILGLKHNILMDTSTTEKPTSRSCKSNDYPVDYVSAHSEK